MLFAMTFIATLAQATTFYVDASATSSTQNGSLATPWKTLSQVSNNQNLFQPGDFVLFKRGETFTGTFYPTQGGTSTSQLTFGAYGTGNKPKFTGTGSTIGYLFYVNNKSYITFRDLWITDPTIDNSDRSIDAKIQRAFTFDQSATNCKIISCDIHLVGVAAYWIGGSNTMDSCDVGNLRMVVDTDQGYQPGYDDDYGANPLVISSADNTITHNYFHDCWATSFDYDFDGGAIEFFGSGTNNNFIGYNTIVDCIGLSEITGASVNNTFAYNKLLNNGSLFYFQSGYTYAGYNLYNNVIVENVNPRIAESRMIGGSMSAGSVIMKNNVFQLSNGVDVAGNTTAILHEDNIYKLSNNSLIGFTVGSTELSTVAAIFINTTPPDPIAWNYAPAASSPAIDFGQNVGLTKDFAGNTVPVIPNGGILESASPTSTLGATATSGSISCNGGTTIVTVTGSGGTAPYSGTGTFTVTAGTYTYTITDAAGGSKTVSIIVNQPTVISASTLSGTIGVFGGTTTITVVASGGTGAHTYKLNGGSYQSSNIFSAVAAGTHTVTVKDANGCTLVKTVTLTQPAAPAQLIAASSATDISCNGGTSIVTISATGGVAPYTGTGNFTVSAGTYSYAVSDASGTTTTTSITVGQPSAIAVTISAGTIAVFGGTTTVAVNPAGGTGAYTYKLNGGSYQQSNTFAAVSAGNHAVTVKDANGCTSVKNFTLSQPVAPAQLVAAATAGSIACSGETTTVTVTATGGVTPYTGTGDFTETAGTFTYTVTDAAGTATTTSITIGQPTAIAVNISAGTIAAFGGTTTITVNSMGGSGAHTYKLNGGAYQASNNFAAVAAGSHIVTVKDANGCTAVTNLTLTQPAPPAQLVASASAGTIDCNAGTTTVAVTATGGTAPYTGTGIFSTGAGTYNYTVTDASGATAITSVTVTQPAAIAIGITAGTILINGGTAAVTVNAGGGTAPYSYKLNAGSYQVSNTFAAVTAGNYVVTVRDANGCTSLNNFTVTQPALNTLAVSAIPTVIICNGDISTITVSATGGTVPYTGIGLLTGYAGTYTYTVTDATGALATTTITITQPVSIVATAIAGTILRPGETTSVTVTATGGTGTYTYKLDNGPFQPAALFTGVPSGTHNVTIKDGNGCSIVKTITIAEPVNPNYKIKLLSKTNVTCRNGNTGSLEVLATGGRAPYFYQLNNGRFTSTNTFRNLVSGVYRVTSKDADGRLISLVAYIFDGRRTCSSTGLKGKVSVTPYPNPTSDRFTVAIESETEEDVVIEVMNLYGKKVFETKGAFDKKYVFGQNLVAGTYFLRVIQANKITTQKVIKL